MTSKAAKAAAVTTFVSGVRDYDHAVLIYEGLGKTFGPVDDVLWFYDTERWATFEQMGGETFWELLETLALTIDATRKHFEESND